MKSISPNHYTKEYYLTNCAGYKTFINSNGQKLDRRLKEITKNIPIKKGFKFLDIGCGRGEIVFWAAKKGCKSWGVDYSKDAIMLANKVKSKLDKKLKNNCIFENKTISQMNFGLNSFDVITLVEVMEHLYPAEQLLLLKKIRKWLKKDGFLFIHTEPNKLFNNYAYKYYCYPVGSFLILLSNLLTNHKYPKLTHPKNIRSSYQKLLHVNEPKYKKLKQLFNKTGFKGNIYSSGISVVKPINSWKDTLFNLITYLHPLSNYFPFNILFGSDFYVILTKK